MTGTAEPSGSHAVGDDVGSHLDNIRRAVAVLINASLPSQRRQWSASSQSPFPVKAFAVAT